MHTRTLLLSRFGEAIRSARERIGMSLRQLARETGISATYLSKIERGLLPAPADDKIFKLSEVLKLDPDELFALAGRMAGDVYTAFLERPVLFTLLAERYERGSVLITSNLPFSKWEAIFKDPMTTASAIDRLVHHSVILELNIASYRMEHAKQKKTEHE